MNVKHGRTVIRRLQHTRRLVTQLSHRNQDINLEKIEYRQGVYIADMLIAPILTRDECHSRENTHHENTYIKDVRVIRKKRLTKPSVDGSM